MDKTHNAHASLRDISPPTGDMVNILVVGSLVCVLLLVGLVYGFTAGMVALLR